MKKWIFIMLLIMLATMLAGQVTTGLYGLYFGESFANCKAQLESRDFIMISNLSVKKEFGLQNPTDAYLVQLYINPANQTLVSWSVHYVDTLNDDMAAAIYQECIDLHGEDYEMLKAEKIAVWGLGGKKSLVIGYDEKGYPKASVYFDEDYSDLVDGANK